jgi:hypothetical protein
MLIEPENEFGKQLEPLARLDDEDDVARYRAFENWHKHTQDIPGPFDLWTVEHLFRDNELMRGELGVGGEHVDLERFSMPVNLLAGAKDRMRPPGQVFALADAVATKPADVVRRMTGAAISGCSWGTRRCASTGLDPRRRARAIAPPIAGTTSPPGAGRSTARAACAAWRRCTSVPIAQRRRDGNPPGLDAGHRSTSGIALRRRHRRAGLVRCH